MKLLLMLISMLLTLHSVKGQACTSVNNCDSCANPGPECQECASNKVLSEDNKQCLDCPTDCAVCELDDNGDPTCTECASGYLDDGACTPCEVDDCMLCDDAVTCTKCEGSGLSLSGGECTGCPDGKYSDSGSCKNCPSNAVKCTTGGTVTECREDGVGYVKSDDSSSCLNCPSDCVACGLDDDGAAVCTQCPENLYVSDAGDCDYCDGDSSSTKNCKSCGDDGVCTECNAKYILENDVCADCPGTPVNCDECSRDANDVLICDVCSKTYGLNEDVICDDCPSNCIACAGGVCSACEAGYALFTSDNTCKACPSDCTTCTYSATATGNMNCLTCDGTAQKGYKDATTELCYNIPTGCAALVSSGVGTFQAGKSVPQCQSCDTAYAHFATDNVCVSCTTTASANGGDPNCNACTASAADTVACTGCADGYGFFAADAVCVSCTTTASANGGDPNCDACTASATDTVACTGCEDGYGFFAADAVCVSCTTTATANGGDPNCDACSASAADTVACTGCAGGYGFFAADAVCVSCTTATNGGEANCDACTASAADTVACTACDTGYELFQSSDAEKCGQCSTGCDTCSKASNKVTCDTCSATYRMKFSSGSATGSCTKCSTNCNACTTNAADNAEICSNCDSEFVLIAGECVACPENCMTCTDGSTCTVCNDEYGLTADATCVACIANCKDCDVDGNGNNICTQCNAEYYVSDDECVDCTSNCLECEYDTGIMICGQCDDAFVITDGECARCPSNCKACSSSTKCTKGECNTGFAVNDAGECQDCAGLTGIANCGTCEEKADANSTAPCTACSAGYTLKDGLQSGDDAECVSVSDLNCQGSPFADNDWQCAADSCTSDTVLTDAMLCGRRCYVCGEFENDVFVEVDKCHTNNETGTEVLCPSGFCAVKSFEEDGKTMVAGGCLPLGEASTECSLENIECQNRGSGDDEVTQCSVCCGDNFCSNDALTEGVTGNHATTALASMMLLVGSFATTLVLL